jgi:hypothetical protein
MAQPAGPPESGLSIAIRGRDIVVPFAWNVCPAPHSFTPVRAAPREPRSWSAGVIEDGEVLEQTIGLCQALIATANRVGRVDCFREWSFSSNGWVGDMLIVRFPPPGPAFPAGGPLSRIGLRHRFTVTRRSNAGRRRLIFRSAGGILPRLMPLR